MKSSVNENAVASEVLTKALALLGPNGENWIQGGYVRERPRRFLFFPQPSQYCAVGALMSAASGPWKARRFLEEVTGKDAVSTWNDAPERTFPEVKSAFEKAIALAKESEQANG